MKTLKIKYLIPAWAALLSAGLYSCSDDDVRTPLDTPQVIEESATYNSVSFRWPPVANALEYGYRVSDSNGVAVAADVTQKTYATVGELEPNSTYTVEVWPYAAVGGEYSTPPCATISATTAPIVKLSTPTLEIDQEEGIIYAFWSKVPDAEYYVYSIKNSEGSEVKGGESYDSDMEITGLDLGDYTFSIYAATTRGGFENGDAASAPFAVEVMEIWRVEGTYHSAEFDQSWPATMVAYNNSTYSILSFYGVDGYNLDFAINPANPDDMFSLRVGERYDYDTSKYWLVPTGLESPDMIWTYPWDNFSYMTGDQYSGEVGVGGYYGSNFDWGYDTFTW